MKLAPLTLTVTLAGSLLMAAPASAALFELADPAITDHAPQLNSGFAAENVFDDDLTQSGSYIVNNEPLPFIDFDFGVATRVTGFDFYQRGDDPHAGLDVTAFELIFDDNADFDSPLATVTVDSVNIGSAALTEVRDFDVTARYVKFNATDKAGNFTGSAEMQFFTTTVRLEVE